MSTDALTPPLPTDLARSAEVSGWARPVKLWQPRNPAYWLYVWLMANGTFLYVTYLIQTDVDPSTLVLAIALNIVLTLVYVYFFGRADRYEREPAKLAAFSFLFGGLVSTWAIAAPANASMFSLWSKWFGPEWAQKWGAAFTAPLTEETAKLAAVIIAAMLARQHIRGAYDGLLLGMFAGLGFQVFENVSYMTKSASSNFNSEPVKDAVQVFAVRAATGVFGHWLWTAVAGAGVGYYLGSNNQHLSKARRLAVAGGLLLAVMVSHGLFDAVLGLGVIALPIAIVMGIAAFVLTIRFTERRSRDFVAGLLAEDAAAGNVTADELAYLTGTRHDRRKHLRHVKREHGRVGKQRAAWVMEAQNDLAAAIAATEDPHSPQAEAARAELARLRTVDA